MLPHFCCDVMYILYLMRKLHVNDLPKSLIRTGTDLFNYTGSGAGETDRVNGHTTVCGCRAHVLLIAEVRPANCLG